MGRTIAKSKRNSVIARDGSNCYLCGTKCAPMSHPSSVDPSGLTLDHVIPLAHGGSNRNENLRVCCFSCNRAKGNAVPESHWFRLMAHLARWEHAMPREAWL